MCLTFSARHPHLFLLFLYHLLFGSFLPLPFLERGPILPHRVFLSFGQKTPPFFLLPPTCLLGRDTGSSVVRWGSPPFTGTESSLPPPFFFRGLRAVLLLCLADRNAFPEITLVSQRGGGTLLFICRLMISPVCFLSGPLSSLRLFSPVLAGDRGPVGPNGAVPEPLFCHCRDRGRRLLWKTTSGHAMGVEPRPPIQPFLCSKLGARFYTPLAAHSPRHLNFPGGPPIGPFFFPREYPVSPFCF